MRLFNTAPVLAVLPLAAVMALPGQAQAFCEHCLEELDSALTGGKPLVDMRLRHEQADDNVNREARATTLRTRLGYETGQFHGFSMLGEMENLASVGNNRHGPMQPDYTTIADVRDTVLNRAQLDYRGLTGLHATLGRQRIVFDNARHVGDVGWRQNNQTYDAARLRYNMFGLTLDYAHINKVNAVVPANDMRVGHDIFQARFEPTDSLNLGYYGLFLDEDDQERESSTHGVVVHGEPRLAGLNWAYRLEYARQTLEENGDEYDTSYLLTELGLIADTGSVALVHEILGTDSGEAGFQTDLATKHGFNGWADVFLQTPNAGLRDAHLRLGTELASVNIAFRYHVFRSDRGDIDYGDELNLQLTRSWGKYTLGAKMARFTADDLDQVVADADDTDRFWLWASLSF